MRGSQSVRTECLELGLTHGRSKVSASSGHYVKLLPLKPRGPDGWMLSSDGSVTLRPPGASRTLGLLL